MAIQPFGVKVKEKHNRKLSFEQIISIVLSIALLFSTVYYASQNDNLQKSNADLQNLLYNYTPFIFSNYSSSNLQNIFFSINDSVILFDGWVNVDLKVVSPYDGMLNLDVKNLNFTDMNGSYDIIPYYFNVSLLQYSKASIAGANNHQYFISKNVMNPIVDKIEVQMYVYLNTGVLQDVFKDVGVNSTLGVGFPLGDMTFQATLFETQINRNYTQNFIEGIHCEINKNPQRIIIG